MVHLKSYGRSLLVVAPFRLRRFGLKEKHVNVVHDVSRCKSDYKSFFTRKGVTEGFKKKILKFKKKGL